MNGPDGEHGISLPDGRRVPLLVAEPDADGRSIVSQLRIPAIRGVVVLNGGTRPLTGEPARRVTTVLEELAAVTAAEGLVAVTGGTDAGIFALFGTAMRGRSPVVGITPEGAVQTGQVGLEGERVALEPNHSHHVVVRGDRWGVETAVMLAVARALAAGVGSVAVLAGGGELAQSEVRGHLHDDRPVIVVEGSGRLADRIAAAVRHGAHGDPDVEDIADSPLIHPLPANAPPGTLEELLRELLAMEGAG